VKVICDVKVELLAFSPADLSLRKEKLISYYDVRNLVMSF
jgi:hypothetical protein